MTTSMTAPVDDRKVIVGVDTHKHVHVAVAIGTWGARLEHRSFSADSAGYVELVEWAQAHGRIEALGIEGTGSYDAGLTSVVRRRGHRVIEVNRGDRRTRRANGKSDAVDAEAAARSVLAGQSTAVPKTADGNAEMLRQVKIARDTAVKARTSAIITLKQIVVNAPAELREELAPLGDKALVLAMRTLRAGATSPRQQRQRSTRCALPGPTVAGSRRRDQRRTTVSSTISPPGQPPPCAPRFGLAPTLRPNC